MHHWYLLICIRFPYTIALLPPLAGGEENLLQTLRNKLMLYFFVCKRGNREREREGRWGG